MKKLYILLAGLFFISQLAIAQKDPAAKKVLDGVSAKLKTFKGISGNFTIKNITSKGKINGTKSGTIQIKGSKYFLKQGKAEIISDGVTIHNYDGNKTITESSASDNDNMISPQNLLSNFYDKDFSYKLISSAGTAHQIELKPTDARKNYKTVTVFVDKAKNMITKAKIVDKSNNVIEFSLTNVNTAATIADKVFVYNRKKYPADAEEL